MVKKFCKYCLSEFEEEDFPLAGVINGKTYRRRRCKKCYYALKGAYKRTVAEWLDNYKKGLSCEFCGFADYRGLVFHHKDGLKDFDIAEAPNRCSINTLKLEIQKCIVLCANCHLILHHKERNGE